MQFEILFIPTQSKLLEGGKNGQADFLKWWLHKMVQELHQWLLFISENAEEEWRVNMAYWPY